MASKDKNIAGMLALFFGGLGLHRFYLGQPGCGLVYLFFCWTLIPSIIAFVDAMVLFFCDKSVFDQKYNLDA